MKKVTKISDLKLCVVGHNQHGKDTVCQIIQDKFNANFITSSQYCCEKFIFDKLRHQFNYTTIQQCFDDRDNHRDLWFTLINEYRQNDETKIATEILSKYNVYCGMRSIEELNATQDMFDCIIWVDASKRKLIGPSSSMTILERNTDCTIDNNDVPELLPYLVEELCNAMLRDMNDIRKSANTSNRFIFK